MIRTMLLPFVIMIALFLPPLGHADDQTFSAVARSVMDEYSKAMLEGDAEKFLSLWTDDAVQMPQQSGMTIGKETLERIWRLAFRVETYEVFDIQITDAYADMNLGVVYGNYKWVYRLKSGTRVSRYGKYVSVLKKYPDGTWKIALDCSNTN